jgi:ATP-dependent DNA helicase RecQ
MELNMRAACGVEGPGSAGGPAPRLEDALQGLGLEAFRPGQRETVESVLAGVDTLAVMATGAGKSLCYQLPAAVLPGVTLVVTPLLALMRDQVARAQARGVPAVALSSVGDGATRAARLEAVASGQHRLVFAAPEGLRSPAVLAALKRVGVALLCVDEAHCISAWGHDFRPDYARLGGLRAVLAPPRLLAVTATATLEVQQDIMRVLGMAQPRVIMGGFDRPNLDLLVQEVRGTSAKLEASMREVAAATATGGSAILYCTTRAATNELAGRLVAQGLPARAYHAGLAPALREETQASWERGETRVMVATSAFGMGVDKPDVRLVVHHAIPRSPEAYWQEVGRAGRDGGPARGVLLFDARDVVLARQRLRSATPDEHAVARAYAGLCAVARQDGFVSPGLDGAAAAVAGVVGHAARACVAHLARINALEATHAGVWVRGGPPHALAVRQDLLAAHRRLEDARMGAMVDYVRRATCRRAFLVEYFSQMPAPPCGRCDTCALFEEVPPTAPQVHTARIILSCVARLMGRYGKARVVEVLVGSLAQGVTAHGLHHLSTFGRLRGVPRAAILLQLNALEGAGLLQSVGDVYPVVELTDAGDHAMRTGLLPPLRRPRGQPGAVVPPRRHARAAPAARSPAVEVGGDAGLLGRLRAFCAARGEGRGEQPAPPLGDHTVRALAVLRPRTLEELQLVPGVGARRAASLGPALLELIAQG